jgi:N4-(beta-N-acetylglucosaminyl)-L-asparaginase
MSLSRRNFMMGAGLASASPTRLFFALPSPIPPKPVLISAANGFPYLDRGYEALLNGADTLDSAIEVVRGPEEDPNEDSVGLGGLPNEDGIVQLDASCMHGPTRRAGAAGALENTMHAAMVAKAVMEHTGHVMLAGEGVTKFALELGFPRQDLLTEHSRKVWLLWKESHSNRDWWGPGIGALGWLPPEFKPEEHSAFLHERMQTLEVAAADLGIAPGLREAAIRKVLFPPTGTTHCSAVNARGELSAVTTTSGLAWKISGRLGDSPIIGAGCYLDPEVGSAGATGSGEENIKIAGAHTIVENMRTGMSPAEAGLDALRRIVRRHDNNMQVLRYISMNYYILRRDGAYAGVTLWSGPAEAPKHFAVHDGQARLEKSIQLFEGVPIDWPPTPKVLPATP